MELSAAFTRSLLSGFDRAYADLLRVATRSTGSRDEAGDLVHDTWLRLAEHAQGAADEPPGQDAVNVAPRDATAYLAAMAQNLALDAHRRRQRQGRYLGAEAVREQLAPSHAPDVADTVMYRQALAALEAALAALPERCRAVFVAHRVQGERQSDIAARLGVSLNTVERDLMQANDCIEDALHRWRGNSLASVRRTGRRRSLGTLLGLAGMGLGASVGWQQWQWYRHSHVQWQASWSSPHGRQVRHALPDGSGLWLDALSSAELQYFATRRTVQLAQGAAFFAVARDEDRPFTVQAAGLRVTVLGTRFGVEITPRPDGGAAQVSVQVESGRVRVERDADGAGAAFAHELAAGQGLQWRSGQDAPQLLAQETAAPWRHGELVFADATLGEALQRLSRYTPLVLRSTPDVADLPLSGRVRIAQAQAWIRALPQALPVQVRPQADGGLLVAGIP